MKMGGCSTDCDPAALADDPNVAVVLRGPLADLERARERLEQHGIDAALVRTDSVGAGGCCSTTISLLVARDDAQAAMAVFDSDWRRGLSEAQIAALDAASAIVIDPDAAETTCPACLTTFATGPAQCPDCGLTIA